MKILIIFLLSTIIAVSQTREPIQTELPTLLPKRLKFNYYPIDGNGTSVQEYLTGSTPYFKLENMTLGWHWGGQRKISQVMKSNQCDMTTHIWFDELLNPEWYNPNTNLFIRATWDVGSTKNLYTHCHSDDGILHTKSLCYSAALAHDPTDDYKLIKLANDPMNHIFGFKQKTAGSLIQDPNDHQYRWKVLTGDADPNEPLLEEPMAQ